MMDHLSPGVKALVELEHKTIVQKYGEGYHSDHEAYAVMLEEIEEAQEQLELIKSLHNVMFDHVRHNKPATGTQLDNYEDYASNLAAEAVQIAAVARRWRGGAKGEYA